MKQDICTDHKGHYTNVLAAETHPSPSGAPHWTTRPCLTSISLGHLTDPAGCEQKWRASLPGLAHRTRHSACFFSSNCLERWWPHGSLGSHTVDAECPSPWAPEWLRGERLPPDLFSQPVVLHEQENMCTVFELLHNFASTCYGQGSIQVCQPQVYTFLEASSMKRNTNYKYKIHRSEFFRMRFFF